MRLPSSGCLTILNNTVKTYCKRVRNYLGTSEGSVLIGHRADGFGILIWEKASSQRCFAPKMLSDEWLFIVLRQQVNFDRDQITAAIDCLATPYFPVLYVISGFRHNANEIFAFLGCYARRLVVSDSSVQPVCLILKGQAVQEEFFLCVTFQERRSRISVCLYRLI